jgi:hypothetical protein
MQRLLRSRWLIGMLVLLLLILGGKAIHRAMQPKYEGKTVEEWFAEYTSEGLIGWEAMDIVPFQKLGTNAAKFLWVEYTRKDSKATAWLMAHKDRVTGKKRHWWANTHEKERQANALILLREMGPTAEPLITEILNRLKSSNPEEAMHLVILLGTIQRQPELVVPAIHLSLLSTNLNITQRIEHMGTLGRFGGYAKTSLPELRNRLANQVYTNSGEDYYIARSILMINGPGPELGYCTNNLVWGDFVKSARALNFVDGLGTNARPAAPMLIPFASSLTYESESNYVMKIVREIDP